MQRLKSIWSLLLCLTFLMAGNAQSLDDADTYAKSVKFSKDYHSAAAELVKPFEKDELKVRAIFTWITSNLKYDLKLYEHIKENRREKYRVDARLSEEEARQQRIDGLIDRALSKKRGVCQDYSYLFERMCKHVGIDAAFITGYGRGSENDIGKSFRTSNHAWNAVKLNGEWALLDLTWSEGLNVSSLDNNGFWLVDPEKFIMSHYPDEEKWQLLDRPLSKDEFSKLPYMYGDMLNIEVDSYAPLDGIINKSKGTQKFKFKGDFDEYPLMVIKGRTPEMAEAVKVGDHYEFEVDLKRCPSQLIIGILDGQQVLPLLAYKVK